MGSVPSDLDEVDHEKRRDEIRLIKTRVALGEMDIVGEKVWNGLAKETQEATFGKKAPVEAPPTPVSKLPAARTDSAGALIPEPKGLQLQSGEARQEAEQTKPNSSTSPDTPQSSPFEQEPPAPKADLAVETHQPDRPSRVPSQQQSPPVTGKTALTDPPHVAIASASSSTNLASSRDGSEISLRHAASSLPDAQPRRDISMSTSNYPTGRSLPHSPESNMRQHRHQEARPPVGPRNVSMPGQSVHMGHAPRRSVSQIARDMERNAINERQSTFEAHQGHRSFVSGCSLCSMDYDRM